MVKIEQSTDGNFYTLHLIGKLNPDDYAQIQSYFDPIIQDSSVKLKMMIDQTAFKGLGKVRCVKYHIQTLKLISCHTEKVASIGDKKIQRVLPSIVNCFTSTQIKFFYKQDLQRGLSWLSA